MMSMQGGMGGHAVEADDGMVALALDWYDNNRLGGEGEALSRAPLTLT